MSTRPIFDRFEPEEYAHVLAQFMNVELSTVYDGERAWTILRDAEGNARFLSLADAPVPS
jgi:hypothetical protein